MSPLRIAGLVRTAEQVRRRLAAPLSEEQRLRMLQEIRTLLTGLERSLAAQGASVRDLGQPTQRAWEFLQGLEGAAPAPTAAPGARSPAARAVRIRGLRADLDYFTEQMARAGDDDLRWAQLRSSLETTSGALEDLLRRSGTEAEQLSDEVRQQRGWLAYCASAEGSAAYRRALRVAQPAFDEHLGRLPQILRPILLSFRPIRSVYKWKVYADATRVALPTPLLAFDDDDLVTAARASAGSRADLQRVHEARLEPASQALRQRLLELGGVVDRSGGLHHDLAAAFVRVNERYFGGRMQPPTLTWSRLPTRRKFGHYDAQRDTVMVSQSLDRSEVPEFVVDYVLFHELLHKRHGEYWTGGRRMVHTPEFERDEARFERVAEADAWLIRVAAGST